MSTPALRVCIVAENASKRMGGEAILPFHYFRIFRKRGIDVWLVVHERTRSELVTLFPDDLDRICFVRDQPLQRLFFQLGKLLPLRIAEATFGLANQILTQYGQRRIVRSLVTPRSVVHQPIPVSPKFPSLLWALGAPLIIGPLNGGMDYPPAFRRNESALSHAAIAFGRNLSNMANLLLPGKRRAAVVLVANERTRAALPSGLQGRIIEVPENAVDLSQWTPSAPSRDSSSPDFSSSTPLPTAAMFLFIGRLADWKALDIALEALCSVPEATLEVVGDGPMLSTWQRLTAGLGLTQRVTFRGWLSQQECAAHLHRARALVLPSLYECGGAVVLEAMAMSRPVIATAWGGPADYLDATCGVLVEPAGRASLVQGFAAAMKRFIDSPSTAAQLGEAGRAKLITHFDWEKKADTILEIYNSVLPSDTAGS